MDFHLHFSLHSLEHSSLNLLLLNNHHIVAHQHHRRQLRLLHPFLMTVISPILQKSSLLYLNLQKK